MVTPSHAKQVRSKMLLVFAMAAGSALSVGPARAQIPSPANQVPDPSTGQEVCPLSDSQTANAVAAFAKIAPTLAEEPRCVNCHGGVDPFLNPKSHAGGEMDEKKDDCGDCHDNMPPKEGGSPSKWRMATRPHFFLGKDAKTLCTLMKTAFQLAPPFLGHMKNDNGQDAFVETAFLGTRGLNDEGQALAFGKNYEPIPPKKITAAELLKRSTDWVNAMGEKFHRPAECGCAEMQYGLRVRIHAVMQVPNFSSTFDLGNVGPGSKPPVVPIHFAEDGTLSGEKIVDTEQANVRPGPIIACAGANTQRIRLNVAGKLQTKDDHGEPVLEKIEVKLDANGVSAQAKETCRVPGLPVPPANVNEELPVGGYSFKFSLDPKVGATQTVPLQEPYYTGEVQVTIVRIK